MDCSTPIRGTVQLARRLVAVPATPALPVAASETIVSSTTNTTAAWRVSWAGQAREEGLAEVRAPVSSSGVQGSFSTLAITWSCGGTEKRILVDASGGSLVVIGQHVDVRPALRDDAANPEAILSISGTPIAPLPAGGGPAVVTTTGVQLTRLWSHQESQGAAGQYATFSDLAFGTPTVLSVPPQARLLTIYDGAGTSGPVIWSALPGAPLTVPMGSWSIGIDVPALATSFTRTYAAAAWTWAVWRIVP